MKHASEQRFVPMVYYKTSKPSKSIYYRSHDSKATKKRDYIKKILMEVNFSFILLLALGAIVDFHVEL
jgi:hypothetical protein